MDAVGDAELVADVGHAELRQGRARPDRATSGTACPARGSATCGWGWWHERRARHRRRSRRRRCASPSEVVQAAEAAGADEAEALVVARRVRADPVRQLRDPPERRQRRGVRQPPVRAGPPGRRREHRAAWTTRASASLVERAATIAANVEELEDWPGLPRPTPRRPLPEAWSERHGRREPRAPRRGRPRGHRRRRRGGRHGLRLVLARTPRRSPSRTRRASARAERRTTTPAAHRDDGPRQGHRLRGAVRGRRDRRSTPHAIGREAAELARASANPVEIDARRLPGRAHALRGRRPPRHAGLPRLHGPRRPGGPLVLRGAASRVGSPLVSVVDDGARPGRPADRASTPRASRSSGWTLLDAGVCCDLAVRRPDRGPRRPPLDRPRPPCPEPVRPVPDQHGDGGRRRRPSRSSSAASIAASS